MQTKEEINKFYLEEYEKYKIEEERTRYNTGKICPYGMTDYMSGHFNNVKIGEICYRCYHNLCKLSNKP